MVGIALFRRRATPGLILHSDLCSQYAALDYQAPLEHHGLLCSMSRKGDCYENSAMESFFHTLGRESNKAGALSDPGIGQSRCL